MDSSMATSIIPEQKATKLQKTFNSIFQCLKQQNFAKIYALRQKQSLDKSLTSFFCNLADLCKRYMNLTKIYEQIIEHCGYSEVISTSQYQQLIGRFEVAKEDQKVIQKMIMNINKKEEGRAKLLQEKIDLQKKIVDINVQKYNFIHQNQKLKMQLKQQKEKVQSKDKQISRLMIKIQKDNDFIVDSNRIIKQLQDQNFQLLTQKDSLQRKLQPKQSQIIQTTRKRESLFQETKADDNSVIFSKYFIDRSYLLYQISINMAISASLVKQIQKNVESNIKGFASIYRYDKNIKTDLFHEQVYGRTNILLICKTVQNKIIGGFSNSSFEMSQTRLSQNDLRKHKAFLFNIDRDGLNIFPLKYGFKSIDYDFDYIIFGRDQLNLCRKTCQLISNFCTNSKKRSYYQDLNQKRAYFLSDIFAQTKKIQLLAYEINTIVF